LSLTLLHHLFETADEISAQAFESQRHVVGHALSEIDVARGEE
jgi:hypothetical protein